MAGKMIKDSVFNEIKNNLNHPANILLRQNDLFRWEPQSPTRIFYSIADDQVPFMMRGSQRFDDGERSFQLTCG